MGLSILYQRNKISRKISIESTKRERNLKSEPGPRSEKDGRK